MAVNLSPVGGVAAQFFNNNGLVLAGGKIYTYAAGTNTPQTTYTTSTGNIAHSNPIILDSGGRVSGGGEVWLSQGVTYKFVIKDYNDNLIGTYDNISGISTGVYSVQNFTGDGSTLLFNLTFSPQNENSTFVYINGVYQQKNTYSISGVSLIFSEAPPINSIIEIMYS